MKIYLLSSVKQKIDAVVQNTDLEVSLLGKATKLPRTDTLVVSEVVLLPQVCTKASTELDSDAVGEHIEKVLESGGDPRDWNTWIHSHASMKTYFSRIDEDTISKFMGPFLISICVNSHGVYLARFDLFEPVRITCEDIPVEVWVDPPDEALLVSVKQELAEKVRQKKIVWDDYGYAFPFASRCQPWNWDPQEEADQLE